MPRNNTMYPPSSVKRSTPYPIANSANILPHFFIYFRLFYADFRLYYYFLPPFISHRFFYISPTIVCKNPSTSCCYTRHFTVRLFLVLPILWLISGQTGTTHHYKPRFSPSILAMYRAFIMHQRRLHIHCPTLYALAYISASYGRCTIKCMLSRDS